MSTTELNQLKEEAFIMGYRFRLLEESQNVPPTEDKIIQRFSEFIKENSICAKIDQDLKETYEKKW